jgi:hypothetical protein
MMSSEADLEYALTRVHARHGLRPAPSDWARLEAGRSLASYLERARGSPLAAWVATLDAASDGHSIERSLRSEWQSDVQLIAGWHPHVWQPWLAWLAPLAWLPLLAQLARPEAPPAWLLADPLCGPVAPGTPLERRAALERTALAPLAAGLARETSFAELWAQHWQRIAPRTRGDTRDWTYALLAMFDRYHHALVTASDGDGPGQTLAASLARLFRAADGTAIASACHIGLTALDLQRLRGALAYRCLAGGVF